MNIAVKNKRVKKSTVILGVFIAVMLIAAGAVGSVMADISGVSIASGEVVIEIENGAGASSTAQQLKEAGVIKHPSIFTLMSKAGGYDTNIKPGALTLTSNMSYKDILNLLCEDNRNSSRLVIPEGFEMKQIAARLAEEGLCTEEEFYSAANDNYGYSFLADIPARDMRLEGYLYPDTYIISEGASAHDIIDMMLAEFDTVFTEEYRSRAAQMDMSIDEIVTMASIIERETDSETERAKVAGVFYNRLESGMKLQSCATVQYILGERKAVLSISDTQIPSPYNTYLNEGLPAGPIANPGIDCIRAALYPEETDYLYFVAGADGTHVFSKTYEEHLSAINDVEAMVSVESE